mmetsp:Transcript_46924/g.73446  ORF Transcript_46924/g.73446 Transcript_46924/m.73446 type:complete len:190 (+) Transcript_46924:1202-1771(+)
MAFGFTGQKAFLNGQDLWHERNFMAYTDHGMNAWSDQVKGHPAIFRNNAVFLRDIPDSKDEYAWYWRGWCNDGQAGGPGKKPNMAAPVLSGNLILTKSGKVTECGYLLSDFQALNVTFNDPASVAKAKPKDPAEEAKLVLEIGMALLSQGSEFDHDLLRNTIQQWDYKTDISWLVSQDRSFLATYRQEG